MKPCIIPARGGSKGIPRKNLKEINGRPLIEWTLAQAINSSKLDNIFVSTNDSEIARVSSKMGAEVINRPDSISGSDDTSESALLHSLKEIKDIYQRDIEFVIFLQATSPLRLSGDIDKAINLFETSGADSLFSSSVMEDLTVWNKGSDWESVNFDYKNRQTRQNSNTQYIENGSIYIFKPEILFNNKNRLGGKIESYIMKQWQVHEIDSFDDLELVEHYMKKYL